MRHFILAAIFIIIGIYILHLETYQPVTNTAKLILNALIGVYIGAGSHSIASIFIPNKNR